jgi:GT2 family glycosyltransferase
MQPSVIAVVLNWHSREDTLACVESLRSQSYKRLGILVVDNGSFDGTLEAIRQDFAGVMTLQLEKNLGYTGGNNTGIAKALELGADFIFLVNSDVRLAHDAIATLVRVAEPEVAALGPTVYHWQTPDKVQSAGNSFHQWTGTARILMDAKEDQPRDVDYVAGCAMMMRASVLTDIGPFDERYFAYCEELEWCLRARKAGYRVLHVPSARVWHRWSASVPTPLQQFLVSRNQIWVVREHCHGLPRVVALSYLVAVHTPKRALAAAKRGDWRTALSTLQGMAWHLGLFTSWNPLTQIQER